jgi:hypothetical protein
MPDRALGDVELAGELLDRVGALAEETDDCGADVV